MPKRKINHSAETGKIVSDKEAKANPKETFTQTVEVKPKAKKQIHLLNVKYLFTNKETGTDFVAEILSFDPFTITEHFIKNLCQSETSYVLETPENYRIEEISKEDLAKRLS